MKEPIVTFKNVKTFIGHEGYGLNADLYINGIKSLFILDDGNGGEMRYTSYAMGEKDEIKKQKILNLIQYLNDYIKTLPNIVYYFNNEKFTHIADLNWFVNDQLEKLETNKFKLKMEKLFKTAIVFGIPNTNTYNYIKFTNIQKNKLQAYVDEIRIKYCKNGVEILNTNLKNLGLK